MDYKDFIIGLNKLCNSFNRQPDEEMIEAWYMEIGFLSPEQFKEARIMAIRKCKFMPTPNEFLQFLKGSPEELFEKMLRVSSQANGYRYDKDYQNKYRPKLLAQLSPACVEFINLHGGLMELANKDVERELPKLKKEFVGFLQQKEPEQAYGTYLPPAKPQLRIVGGANG